MCVMLAFKWQLMGKTVKVRLFWSYSISVITVSRDYSHQWKRKGPLVGGRSKESDIQIPFAVSGRASKMSFAASSGALAWQSSTGCLSSRRNSTYHYHKMQFLWWEWYILKHSSSHMLPDFTVCLTACFMGSYWVTSNVVCVDARWSDL